MFSHITYISDKSQHLPSVIYVMLDTSLMYVDLLTDYDLKINRSQLQTVSQTPSDSEYY